MIARTTRRSRTLVNRIFTALCWITAMTSVLVLAVLLIAIARQGIAHLNLSFLTDAPSRRASRSGMGPAIWGSIWVCTTCALLTLPLGIASAIFLEEYRPKRLWARKLHSFAQLNIANLAGVPSIVYGVLGLTVFVQAFGLFGSALNPSLRWGIDHYDQFADAAGQYFVVPTTEHAPPIAPISGMTAYTEVNGDPIRLRAVSEEQLAEMRSRIEQRAAEMPEDAQEEIIRSELTGVVLKSVDVQRFDVKHWWYFQLPFGRGVLAGALTLMLVILPIVIISSQEALRATPPSLREGALALGATQWQMIRRTSLPAAIPGIMTGSILAMSRAIGEAAPILVIAGIVYITFAPHHLMDDFTHMPLQIYNWAQQPQKEFHEIAATGIIVLLAVLLTFNAAAVLIRQRFQKQLP